MLNGFRKARLIQGLSVSEVARSVGVTPGAVSQWETGRAMPNVGRLKKVAEILHTTVEKLLEEERAM